MHEALEYEHLMKLYRESIVEGEELKAQVKKLSAELERVKRYHENLRANSKTASEQRDTLFAAFQILDTEPATWPTYEDGRLQ